MESFIQDVRIGIRGLWNRPGFTAAAILTFALGVGGNTALFSVVRAVLIEPLPYPEAERLTFLWSDLTISDYRRAPLSAAELADLRRFSLGHEDFGAIWASAATLVEGGRPQSLRVGMVTVNFLALLGVEPIVGRAFEESDEATGAPPRVLVSGALWQERFGGDRNLVGRAIRIDGGWGVPGGLYTVIGVMPPGFEMLLPADSSVPTRVDVWIPFQDDIYSESRNLWYLRTIGRLAPGVSLAEAQEEMVALGQRIEAAHTEYAGTGRSFYPVSLHGDGVREVRPALLALFGGSFFVLLIACANVANLLLARAALRRREISIRAALGAGRGRLARQLMTESLLLAAGGAVLGLFVAAAGLDLLRTFGPGNLPRLAAVSLSPGVLAFSVAVATLCGLVFGMAPVWASWRLDLERALHMGGDGADRRHGRAHNLLVIAEVAVSIVLLTGAGLMIRSFGELREVDPGFRDAGVLTFQLSPPRARYQNAPELANFSREIEGRLSELPGVESVGVINQLPLSDLPNWSTPWRVRASADSEELREADARVISPGYFQAVEARLVTGRFFERSDDETSRKVVIVDEKLASQAWPDESALGQEIYVGLSGGPTWAEVVGVVRHLRHHDLRHEVRGQVYAPFAQGPRNQVSVAVRGSGDVMGLLPAVRGEIAKIDPALALSDAQPLGQYLSGARTGARFRMILAGLMGALALVLAAVGIYGVISFAVARRRQEIGVRLALGGTPDDIVRLFVARGMRLLLAGAVLGLGAALMLGRFLETLLFEVVPSDPANLLVTSLILMTVAAAACYLPARRAGGVDPVRSLRSD